MKNKVKTIVTCLCVAIFSIASPVAAFPATAITVDGLCYYLNMSKSTAYLTYKNPGTPRYTNLNGDLVIPDSITYEGNSYTVTTIGSYAFQSCSGITSVTIPNTVTTIEKDAFQWCSGITSLTIPNSVTTIGESAFQGCSGITSLTIPNSITSIDYSVFSGCSGITSVTIPNTVTTIGEYAFQGCKSLTSLTIPNSVTSIGNSAFSTCPLINNIVVAQDNPKYDSRDDCNAIIETATNVLILGCTTTIIPNTVTSIGFGAFSGCENLTSIVIPNSVTAIGDAAFSNCRGLTSVTIPNSVTTIGRGAFYSCTSLTGSLTIPNSVTTISDHAFYACHGLTSVLVGYSVTSISNGAFYGCNNLTSVTLGNSVTTIGDEAFDGCGKLTSVTLGNSIITIGEKAFASCCNLKSMTLGNCLTRIGYQAFYNCYNLTSVTLTGIGSSSSLTALSGIISQIKTVKVGSGITSLGATAQNGSGLAPEVVNCYAQDPPVCESSTFSSYKGELHVPYSSTVEYLTAPYWQNFNNMNFDITEQISLDTESAEMIQWDELQLTATFTPEGSGLNWSSTNGTVASVDENGMVTARGKGECYIYCTLASNDAVYAWCHITSNYPAITALTLSEESLEFNAIGETATLVASATPDNTGLKPTWKTSNASVATVDASGVVTATGEGECDITATLLGKKATCHVKVTAAIIITLEESTVRVKSKGVMTLTPLFDPLETEIAATSSDPDVVFARVVKPNAAPATGAAHVPVAGQQQVQVVGLKNGTATVTITSTDGTAIPATCVVTVCGDVNGDTLVSGADVTSLYGLLLDGTYVAGDADVNGDGIVNGADVTALYTILLEQ